jgi:hypothetical protein
LELWAAPASKRHNPNQPASQDTPVESSYAGPARADKPKAGD